MRRLRRDAFTLIEVLIVVVIMAVLAAVIIPQFTDTTDTAREATAQFNVQGMRQVLELYRAQHNGQYPPQLTSLTVKTNVDHSTGGTPTFGPYITEIPTDGVTGSSAVATSSADPITVSGTTGGWIYNATTGEIRINHSSYSNY